MFLSPYFRANVYTRVTKLVPLALGASRRPFSDALGQLNATTPHLTNRYLNFLAFMAAEFPQETKVYLSSLDRPSRDFLAALKDASVHGKAPKSRNAVIAVAALTTLIVLAMFGLGMTQWRAEIVAALEPSLTPVPTYMPDAYARTRPDTSKPTVFRTADLGLSILLSAVRDEVEPRRGGGGGSGI